MGRKLLLLTTNVKFELSKESNPGVTSQSDRTDKGMRFLRFKLLLLLGVGVEVCWTDGSSDLFEHHQKHVDLDKRKYGRRSYPCAGDSGISKISSSEKSVVQPSSGHKSQAILTFLNMDFFPSKACKIYFHKRLTFHNYLSKTKMFKSILQVPRNF